MNFNLFETEIARIYSILDREHNRLRYTETVVVKLSIPVGDINVFQDIHVGTTKAKLLTLANDVYLRSFKIRDMYRANSAIGK